MAQLMFTPINPLGHAVVLWGKAGVGQKRLAFDQQCCTCPKPRCPLCQDGEVSDELRLVLKRGGVVEFERILAWKGYSGPGTIPYCCWSHIDFGHTDFCICLVDGNYVGVLAYWDYVQYMAGCSGNYDFGSEKPNCTSISVRLTGTWRGDWPPGSSRCNCQHSSNGTDDDEVTIESI